MLFQNRILNIFQSYELSAFLRKQYTLLALLEVWILYLL